MKKLTLLEQIQERTKKNIVKVGTKKNICDSLHEILYTGNQELRRIDIIALISFERLQDEFPKLKEGDDLTDEQLKRIDNLNITVKNGLDTAVCNGSTSSSYCSNEQYANFQLIKNGDKLKIVEKSK